jgi:hypothetical protein
MKVFQVSVQVLRDVFSFQAKEVIEISILCSSYRLKAVTALDTSAHTHTYMETHTQHMLTHTHTYTHSHTHTHTHAHIHTQANQALEVDEPPVDALGKHSKGCNCKKVGLLSFRTLASHAALHGPHGHKMRQS